jgi:8-oxo-dGTP pyrophosphatase MutT (NUDIX family)
MTISIPTPRAGDLDPIATPPPTAPEAAQVAALCWRMHKGRVQVLLVTSRDTGRWVLPKG